MDGFLVFKTVVFVFSAVFVPGIALSLALFPDLRKISIVERMGLSFLLGLTPSLILYFLNKNLSVEITTGTSLLAYILLTFFGLILWMFRSQKSQ